MNLPKWFSLYVYTFAFISNELMQNQYILISQFTASSGLYNFYDVLILT